MRGIIIAVPKKYQEITLRNLVGLRLHLNCKLPVEIWEIGKEVDNEYREKYLSLGNVSCLNVEDYTNNPKHWLGFQVKAFILKNTTFEEPILCDADMIFHQNPEIIYDNPGYMKTGAYFFRDLSCWTFNNLHETDDKFQSIDFFNKRKG